VIAALAGENDSSIVERLQKGGGKFDLIVSGKKVVVKESHLVLEK
jgi:hypothetical protein